MTSSTVDRIVIATVDCSYHALPGLTHRLLFSALANPQLTANAKLGSKLPSIEHRRQADRATILANPNSSH